MSTTSLGRLAFKIQLDPRPHSSSFHPSLNFIEKSFSFPSYIDRSFIHLWVGWNFLLEQPTSIKERRVLALEPGSLVLNPSFFPLGKHGQITYLD